MRKAILLPLTAVVAGGIGFGFRYWELGTAFQPETGLPTFGLPPTLALIALTILAAALFAVLCKPVSSGFSQGYDQAFAAPTPVYLAVMVLAALLMAAAGIVGMKEFVTRENPMLTRFILSLLLVAAAVCVASTGLNNYRRQERGKFSLTLLIPAYACCLWLIVAYQGRAADPILLDYVYHLFAIMAAVLSLYFMAGFAFERAKSFRCAFFSLLGIYFGLVSLADTATLFTRLLTVSVVLLQLAGVAALLHNAESITEVTSHESE